MKFLFYLFLLFLEIYATLLSQELVPTETNVTIYQNNYASIRQKVMFNLNTSPGSLSFTIPSSQVIPSSLSFTTKGDVLEQSFSQPTDQNNLWKDKAIGANVTVFSPNAQSFKGKLVHFSDFAFILNSNEQKTIFIKDLEGYTIVFENHPYPEPEKPKVVWLLKPERIGQNSGELVYHTFGVNWVGRYFIYLDEEKERLSLNAFAYITNNSGINFENVNLKLVEGKINVFSSPIQYANSGGEMMAARTVNFKFEQEEPIFDFFEYTYPLKVDLKNNETKLLNIFKALEVPYKKTYKYDLSVYPVLKRKEKPTIEISFINKKENNLGRLLPRGMADLYIQSKNATEFIGSCEIQSIYVGDMALLNAGNASDLVVEVKKAEHIQYSTTLTERRYTVVCYNFKNKEASIVIDYYDTQPLALINTNFKPQVEESSRLVFNIPIKPNSSVELRFEVQAGE